jgi:hypothetical protein
MTSPRYPVSGRRDALELGAMVPPAVMRTATDPANIAMHQGASSRSMAAPYFPYT